jgi:hypothetical protein
MDQLDDRAPRVSLNAMRLYGRLVEGSGTLRLKPLLETTGLSPEDLVATLNELKERCWIKIAWRHDPAASPDDETRPLRDAIRITATRFGRWRYKRTWVEQFNQDYPVASSQELT